MDTLSNVCPLYCTWLLRHAELARCRAQYALMALGKSDHNRRARVAHAYDLACIALLAERNSGYRCFARLKSDLQRFAGLYVYCVKLSGQPADKQVITHGQRVLQQVREQCICANHRWRENTINRIAAICHHLILSSEGREHTCKSPQNRKFASV